MEIDFTPLLLFLKPRRIRKLILKIGEKWHSKFVKWCEIWYSQNIVLNFFTQFTSCIQNYQHLNKPSRKICLGYSKIWKVTWYIFYSIKICDIYLLQELLHHLLNHLWEDLILLNLYLKGIWNMSWRMDIKSLEARPVVAGGRLCSAKSLPNKTSALVIYFSNLTFFPLEVYLVSIIYLF